MCRYIFPLTCILHSHCYYYSIVLIYLRHFECYNTVGVSIIICVYFYNHPCNPVFFACIFMLTVYVSLYLQFTAAATNVLVNRYPMNTKMIGTTTCCACSVKESGTKFSSDMVVKSSIHLKARMRNEMDSFAYGTLTAAQKRTQNPCRALAANNIPYFSDSLRYSRSRARNFRIAKFSRFTPMKPTSV